MVAKKFWIGDLPKVAESIGWKVCAVLLRRWLDGPSLEFSSDVRNWITPNMALPAVAVFDAHELITVDWARKNLVARKSYDDLKSHWLSPTIPSLYSNKSRYFASVDQIRSKLLQYMLSAAGSCDASSDQFTFDPFKKPVWQMDDEAAFQSQPIRFLPVLSTPKAAIKSGVGSATWAEGAVKSWAVTDEFVASVFNSAWRMAFSASVVKIHGTIEWEVTVTEVGIYLVDAFEFFDAKGKNQRLGFWSSEGFSLMKFDCAPIPIKESNAGPPSTYFEVSNQRFREYRNDSNKGGDFRVFGEVRKIPLISPLIFDLSVPFSIPQVCPPTQSPGKQDTNESTKPQPPKEDSKMQIEMQPTMSLREDLWYSLDNVLRVMRHE